MNEGNTFEAIGYFGKAIDCGKYFKNDFDIETGRNLQGLGLAHAEKGDYEVSQPLLNEAGFITGK